MDPEKPGAGASADLLEKRSRTSGSGSCSLQRDAIAVADRIYAGRCRAMAHRPPSPTGHTPPAIAHASLQVGLSEHLSLSTM